MKEYTTDYGSLIGGWYISENVCDNLIDFFHSKKDHWRNITREDHKKSTEMYVNASHSGLCEYSEELRGVFEKYIKRYNFCNKVQNYGVIEDLQIQHYKPGEAFYGWHCENDGWGNSVYRHLVFMTYLNTLDNAGTEFYHQNIKTPCEKGLTIIWPTTWTHTHRGILNNVGDKYIITGWYSFNGNK